jgi:glyoxylate reductase
MKIVLSHPFLPEIMREELAPHARIVVAPTRARLLRAIRDADGLISRGIDPIDDAFLAHAPRLKAVANFAVGYNNIDLRACARRGIRVANTPGVLSRAVAELTLLLLLGAARRLHEGETMCRKNRFPGWDPRMLVGLQLAGRRALLVGRGSIGRETAKLFSAIGLKVEWVTRRDSDASIRKKLARAQILSFHCPLTPETHHWLNARRLALLPRDAIVLNTTRGPVIDEAALIRALKMRRIFAAGLDVFEHEPEIPAALRRLPNVVLLPHVGSATHEAREAMARLAARGVLALVQGRPCPNEVRLPEQETARPD